MRFYWFGRQLDKDLKYVSDILEDSGFYGWLLPYATGLPDQFIRVARSLDTNQKLKYLIAVRPYNISPQYVIALSKACDNIQKDRVRINFVPGVINEDEKEFGGIMGNITDNSNFVDRKKFFCSYLEEFNNLLGEKPYHYISGISEDICPVIHKFGDANIISYGKLIEGRDEPVAKTRVISASITNINQVEEKIETVKSKGYEDIMFHVDGDDWFPLALQIFKKVKEYNQK